MAFFELSPVERAFFRKGPFRNGQVTLFNEEVNEVDPKLFKGLTIISVFIYSKLDAKTLSAFPRLKFIATRSTGFDHIDLAYCKRKGLRIANVPHYGENTVAEHTFALILALSRNIHRAYVRTVQSNFSLEGLQGFDLQGKALGVIGTGRIGLHVIRMANGFGMKVLGYDTHPNRFMAEVLGFAYVPLKELLGHSDIITLHAPYNDSTHHLMNEETLRGVKRGALLINTARGGLVDTNALAVALDQGILGGAGLDVLEGEELIKEERQILTRQFSAERLKTLLQNHILLHRENVVITPHIAFNSREAFLRILHTTVENIQGFLSGQPQNLV